MKGTEGFIDARYSELVGSYVEVADCVVDELEYVRDALGIAIEGLRLRDLRREAFLRFVRSNLNVIL